MRKRIAKKIMYNRCGVFSYVQRLSAARHIAKNLPDLFSKDYKYICFHCKKLCTHKYSVSILCYGAYIDFLRSKGFKKMYIDAGVIHNLSTKPKVNCSFVKVT